MQASLLLILLVAATSAAKLGYPSLPSAPLAETRRDTHEVASGDAAALLAIRQAWRDPLARLWQNSPSCSWQGVTCAVEDDENRVVALVLNFLLAGAVPSELGNLTALIHLDLSSNQLTGELPGSLQQLTRLTTALLFNNSLTGALLASFPASARQVVASLNLFDDLLPTSAHLQAKQLDVLDVSYNLLNGSISALFNRPTTAVWPNLQALDLSHNQLVDSSTWVTHSAFPVLMYLDLSNNLFTGPLLPEQLPRSLLYYYLANNTLYGDLPRTFNDMPPNLLAFDVSNNRFQNSLPSSLAINSIATLLYFDVHHNLFSGPLPSLGIESLQYLDISDNAVEGSFPAQFETSNLEYLDAALNALSGQLPDWICDIASFDATANGFDCPNPDCCAASSHRCGHCLSSEQNDDDGSDGSITDDGSPFSLVNIGLGLGGFFLTLLLCSPLVWFVLRKIRRPEPAYISATTAASDDDDNTLLQGQSDDDA